MGSANPYQTLDAMAPTCMQQLTGAEVPYSPEDAHKQSPVLVMSYHHNTVVHNRGRQQHSLTNQPAIVLHVFLASTIHANKKSSQIVLLQADLNGEAEVGEHWGKAWSVGSRHILICDGTLCRPANRRSCPSLHHCWRLLQQRDCICYFGLQKLLKCRL